MLESTNNINQAMFNLNNTKLSKMDDFSAIKNNDEKMKKTAGEFEAVFLNKLFQVMDSTIDRSENFLSGGNAENTFRSMMYQEISKDVSSSQNTSFGFAKQIYEQMKDI